MGVYGDMNELLFSKRWNMGDVHLPKFPWYQAWRVNSPVRFWQKSETSLTVFNYLSSLFSGKFEPET